MSIQEIVERYRKDHDDEIVEIYFQKLNEYAIYRTRDVRRATPGGGDRPAGGEQDASLSRVKIEYADDDKLEKRQRTGIAGLNPIRGEINGLIDGWRSGKEPPAFFSSWADGHGQRLRAKAARFDRRVADALNLALEEDVVGASRLLTDIKNDRSRAPASPISSSPRR